MSSAGREEKEGCAGQEREGRGPERDGKAAQGDTGEKTHGGGRVESVSQCDEHCGGSEVLSSVRNVLTLQTLHTEEENTSCSTIVTNPFVFHVSSWL